MRVASASWRTSPGAAEAVPPAFKIASTRLSTPPQLLSRSPGALCSLATPAGRTSETTTVTPLAASARAVELPMPIGLPQPVISATRDDGGILSLLSSRLIRQCRPPPPPPPPPPRGGGGAPAPAAGGGRRRPP